MVDDEPDVEVLFRQQFRRDLRAERFTMEFAQSGPAAIQRINDAEGVSLILILSDVNMPGMNGLELLPKAKATRDAPAGSSGRCNTSIKSFGWGCKSQSLAWSFVELPSHFVELGLRVHGQVSPLRQVLRNR